MISYYNSRPGHDIKLTVENLPRRRARWRVSTGKNGKKSMSLEDAKNLRATLQKDSTQTLTSICEELQVKMDTLKLMLKSHGLELNFYYRE